MVAAKFINIFARVFAKIISESSDVVIRIMFDGPVDCTMYMATSYVLS